MWSSSHMLRNGLVVLTLSLSIAVSACTFRPVYGENGVVQQRLDVAYAKPATRLDQLVIQDLALSLGKSEDPDAPLINISASAGSRALATTGISKAATQQEVTVNVSYTVSADGKVVTFGSRSASALWTSRGQVFTDEAARRDAEERAARAAAETVRLSILAALATPVRPPAATAQ